MTPEYVNPLFTTWAELTRALRDRFLNELRLDGGRTVTSPYTGEVMGNLAALITQCEHLDDALARLARNEPKAYKAFLQALEQA